MQKYLKAIVDILINYNFFSIPILISELFFFLRYKNQYNKFKYLNSNFLSDSIPCPFYFLKIIEKFIKKNKIKYICDLGSGYGKTLYFFGKIKNYYIDGVELDREIYFDSLNLNCKKIRIYNQNILTFNLFKKKYDLLIVNDPLKKVSDFKKLISNIIKVGNKKIYIVLINLDQKKIFVVIKYLKILDRIQISENKNIFFCVKK